MKFLTYQLAINCGIEKASSRIDKVTGNYFTFSTERFDRAGEERIHFSSALTMTGNNEDTIRDSPASYLDMEEFVHNYCSSIDENLERLWRRIVFNIAVSNTDDHLGNHDFMQTSKGWVLSQAYVLNPSI